MQRRAFLKTSAVLALAGGTGALLKAAAPPNESKPWYKRVVRWGQTNITEEDPTQYDIEWWRGHWKRTFTQGVIVNAGGIVAYYPSKFPLHYRAAGLGGRDLYGELASAAHADGLVVLARMDSNRVHEDFYRAHPDWIAVQKDGKPYRAGDLYVTCINSPYYDEYLPQVLTEITERSHPEGFTDNSWSGLGRGSICYCSFCQKKFRDAAGMDLPPGKDWNSAAYRKWIRWNYSRRLEVWDLNNRTTQAAGGPDCLWIGMNSGSMSGQGSTFRDTKALCERARMILLDHQARSDAAGFQQNGETGKLIHGLLGWDKLAPESMAMYQAGSPTFRLASKPAPEARMWMIEAIAGGLQPWWHHVAAYHEDRRAYETARPVLEWHHRNERYLSNRQPIARVGLVWSQTNADFYGRDNPGDLVEAPFRGFAQALIKARIPYLPVHADHVLRDQALFSTLILPNVAALSNEQMQSIRRFVAQGGSLLATGAASLCDELGDPRKDFGLSDLFGVHTNSPADLLKPGSETSHTYLRLIPELRARVPGPKTGGEPPPVGERHAILDGFVQTDILPFGGRLEMLQVDDSAQVLATYIPPFPIYPPETAWMRQKGSDIPGLMARELPNGSRVVYCPADLDRRYARENLPDHARLLSNVTRWCCRSGQPLLVNGPGLLDCHLYRQENRLILHLVNLTSAATWRAPLDELIPVGPLDIKVQIPSGMKLRTVKQLVLEGRNKSRQENGWLSFTVPRVLDHELFVLENS